MASCTVDLAPPKLFDDWSVVSQIQAQEQGVATQPAWSRFRVVMDSTHWETG
eukprot:CAMPEP_0114566400 /NCGR_PEP_ID=MMETSP0114-20121206/14865_1 /TAXON_ID=31324 /ORGANISM="Goniomonas sp, Strain m" /LENGTH=51 /DNA_ID=CAMNT_0001752795 /DNA_START=155 /DNA_END=310 /DNA_ORIENTATION=+